MESLDEVDRSFTVSVNDFSLTPILTPVIEKGPSTDFTMLNTSKRHKPIINKKASKLEKQKVLWKESLKKLKKHI